MLSKDIGVDLGTANILIYVKGEGIVLNEPSIVVIDEETKDIIAFGKEADEMIGRTPGKIKVIKPMKDGVIADFEVVDILLENLLKRVNIKGKISKPRMIICCPSNITEVEKQAIKEAAEKTGARKIFIEEEPKVAAIGAGLDIGKPLGNMVVDIGGGTTDIAVLSLGNIVTSASITSAGNQFDQDIIKYIKQKYKLLVGEKTAEKIKINIGTAKQKNQKEKMEVRGRDLVNGLPKTINITSDEVEEALHDSIKKIINMIKVVLEQTPPELSADIIERGITLTGGGALLQNLKEKIHEELHVPVFVAESPLTCVAEGTGILLDNINLIDRV